MKALRVQQYGHAESIALAEVPRPEPKPGEIRVRIEASGISFVDMLVARGGYQVRRTPPFTPGSEFSGVVDAVGPGVTSGLQIGDRVCGTGRGAWAQYLCHAAEYLHPLPSTCNLVEASVVVVPFGTALYALRERGNLVAGETLLVLGAAGGVGYAAVQLGNALGARVIAVASTEAKRLHCGMLRPTKSWIARAIGRTSQSHLRGRAAWMSYLILLATLLRTPLSAPWAGVVGI